MPLVLSVEPRALVFPVGTFPVGALTVGAILVGALRLGFGLIKHLRGRSVWDGRAQHVLGPRRPGPIVLGMLPAGRAATRRPA